MVFVRLSVKSGSRPDVRTHGQNTSSAAVIVNIISDSLLLKTDFE